LVVDRQQDIVRLHARQRGGAAGGDGLDRRPIVEVERRLSGGAQARAVFERVLQHQTGLRRLVGAEGDAGGNDPVGHVGHPLVLRSEPGERSVPPAAKADVLGGWRRRRGRGGMRRRQSDGRL